jgi:hypothetical protein
LAGSARRPRLPKPSTAAGCSWPATRHTASRREAAPASTRPSPGDAILAGSWRGC